MESRNLFFAFVAPLRWCVCVFRVGMYPGGDLIFSRIFGALWNWRLEGYPRSTGSFLDRLAMSDLVWAVWLACGVSF